MLSGQAAFDCGSPLGTLTAILRDSPRSVRTIRPEVPSDLERTVFRCLEKSREARYPSAGDLRRDLVTCRARLTTKPTSLRHILGRPRIAVPAVFVLLALAAGLIRFLLWRARVSWARNEALPQIARLVRSGESAAAFRLAREAERYLPGDPEIQQFWHDYSRPFSVQTKPPGADIYIKEYLALDSGWEYIGKSPIKDFRVGRDAFRLRASGPGFQPEEVAAAGGWDVTLDVGRNSPPDMVYVPSGEVQLSPPNPPVRLQEYWIAKFEVTNKAYKEFVDRGGYAKREYWKQPFVKGGQRLS